MASSSGPRVAAVLGATGLVGGACVERLLADGAFARVVTVGRRALDREHAKLEQVVAELGGGGAWTPPAGVTDAFCCLGTTIGKAGSPEAFRRVDFDLVVWAARGASAAGVGQFLLVSSLGADPASRVFYSRVKGEAEAAVRSLPFRGVQIFRPSLLLGEREEFRLGERVAAPLSRLVSPLLLGGLRRYRPVAAGAVAAAMVRVAREAPAGVNVFESERIAALAASGA
ncbi:MAG TPA: hypothetical protein VLW17_01495 [Thermoanaerobaculaceae bacterium]|nr:hypothetical protein [Thermoanaerobaculaceae bacterium]